MLKTGFSLVKKAIGMAGPVPWSDNTAFPISVSVNNPDYFVGLSGGSNVKWTAATLIDYISPNVTIHVDQIADLSLQATYAISDSPQITGLITFYDGSNSVFNVNGSFLQAYYQSEVAPNVNIAQFLVTGITDTGTNEAAELNFGFANTLAGSVSGFFRANISSIGTIQTLFDLRGGDGIYGARAAFGSAVQSVSIGLNPDTDPLNHSAIFEIVSQAQSQGVILPNLTDSNINTNISSPATSLLVYNTDYDNFNYFDSSATLRSMLRQDQVTSSDTNLVITPNLDGSLLCDIVSIPYFSGLGLGLSSGINASAILEIDSTTKGFLLPRMTALQMLNIPSPATGLQIFNLDRGIPYFYDGTGWIPSVVLAGTTNQINVSFTGFTYTLSTPQNIDNTATPYFSRLALGITSGIDASAIFEVVSTTQGWLPPGGSQAQRNAISSPAGGLQFYNKTTNTNDYFDGSDWDQLLTTSNVLSGTNTTVVNNNDGTITINSSGGSGTGTQVNGAFTCTTNTATTAPTSSPLAVVVNPASFAVTNSSGMTVTTATVDAVTTAIIQNTTTGGARWCRVNFDVGVAPIGIGGANGQDYLFTIFVKKSGGALIQYASNRVDIPVSSVNYVVPISISDEVQLNLNDFVFLRVSSSFSSPPQFRAFYFNGNLEDLTIASLASTDVLAQGSNNFYLSQDGGTTYEYMSGAATSNHLPKFNATNGQLIDSGISISLIQTSNPYTYTFSGGL